MVRPTMPCPLPTPPGSWLLVSVTIASSRCEKGGKPIPPALLLLLSSSLLSGINLGWGGCLWQHGFMAAWVSTEEGVSVRWWVSGWEWPSTEISEMSDYHSSLATAIITILRPTDLFSSTTTGQGMMSQSMNQYIKPVRLSVKSSVRGEGEVEGGQQNC